jgi:hypothetical protein
MVPSMLKWIADGLSDIDSHCFKPLNDLGDDVIEFDIVLDQQTAACGKIGLTREQILSSLAPPPHILANKPRFAAFSNGSQNSRGLLKCNGFPRMPVHILPAGSNRPIGRSERLHCSKDFVRLLVL